MSIFLATEESVEALLFEAFSEFLYKIDKIGDNKKKYIEQLRREEERDTERYILYCYVGQNLLNVIGSRSVEQIFQGKRAITEDRLRFFFDTFRQKFNNIPPEQQEAYKAIDLAFIEWKRLIERKLNRPIQDDEKSGQWEDKNEAEEGELAEETAPVVDKDIFSAEKILVEYFSAFNNEDANKLWELIGYAYKGRMEFKKENLTTFTKIKTKNLHIINFSRSSPSIIECDAFTEFRVCDGVSYAIFLQDLKWTNMHAELQNHKMAFLRFLEYFYTQQTFTVEEKHSCLIQIEDKVYLSTRKLINVAELDFSDDLYKYFPLATDAYIKTYYRCAFSYEHDAWKVNQVSSRMNISKFPDIYPDFYIDVTDMVATEKQLDVSS